MCEDAQECKPLTAAEANKMAKEYPKRACEIRLKRLLESIQYHANCGEYVFDDTVSKPLSAALITELEKLGYCVKILCSSAIRTELRISWYSYDIDKERLCQTEN